jgi:asparagine synthase (glutamine-hydrolysing)
LGVSRHAGLRNNHLFTSFEVGRASTQRGIEVLGHPAEHGNAVGHIPFFRLAKTLGVRTLFSGFGGDEGVTNYANSHRRDLLHTRQYRALWNVLPGNAVTKSLRMGKALTTNRHRAEYVDRFLTGARRRLQDSILLQDVKQDINLEPRILESAHWDAPYDTLNEFVVGMLSKAFVSTRTESCSLVSASYGIEYSWPLLDPRLIQQWLAAPTIEKVHPTMGRYLHRRAIEGIVLDRVRLQPSKYMGSALPNSGGQQIVAEQTGDVTELRDGLSSRLASLINEERLGAVVERYVGRQAKGERSPVDSRTLYSVLAAQQWLTQEISEGLK